MSLGGGIKRNGRNYSHGAKMTAVTYPPECLKIIDSPLLKAKPPCHPPAISARANDIIDSPLLKVKPPRHPPAVSTRANAVAG